MNIIVEDSQISLQISSQRVKKIVKAILDHEKQKCNEVVVHFVTTEEICRLHEEFFNDPSPTDCISFPLDESNDEDYRVLGDVFVCPQTALEYAKKNELNPYEETTLYIIHGLLHLIGYDDIEEEDQLAMRAAEKKHMQNLKNLNLYLK